MFLQKEISLCGPPTHPPTPTHTHSIQNLFIYIYSMHIIYGLTDTMCFDISEIYLHDYIKLRNRLWSITRSLSQLCNRPTPVAMVIGGIGMPLAKPPSFCHLVCFHSGMSVHVFVSCTVGWPVGKLFAECYAALSVKCSSMERPFEL